MKSIKWLVGGLCLFLIPIASLSQHITPQDDTTEKKTVVYLKRGVTNDTSYKNSAAGEFTPGRGFDLVKSGFGTLNISLYAMVRYLNQMPGKQTWYDHLNRPRTFVGRNDFNWHRAMIWFSGWLGTPKLTYASTVWTVMTTQQTLVYGQLQYRFNKYARVGMGIGPNLSIRSLQGSFPFYSSTDRTMGEESLRAGFTNGIWVNGEIVPKLHYRVMVGNNISILGIQASKLTRDLAYSVNLTWMPTTGEFGPRGGVVDLEWHERPATRFGISAIHSREDRFNNIGQPSPDNTQVRMTDGVLFFETDALGNGTTVLNADYDMMSIDAGVKYKGFNLQAEFYARKLSKFKVEGPTPATTKITDIGYSIQPNYMVIPSLLNVYAIHSYFFDEFKRNPWELGGGVNVYPLKNRSWRLNLQVHHVHKSSAGGTFGLYTAGQTGTTFTFGSDILL